MSASTRSPQHGRQSWRESKKRSAASPVGRHAARWFVTLCALGLMGTLVVVMMRGCRAAPATHFAGFEIPYDVGIAAPRLVSTTEAAALAATLTERAYRVRVSNPDLWKAPTESGSMDKLPLNFRQMAMGEDDTLIFFVSAHGIAMDGEAYLLSSDFALGDLTGPTGHYPVRSLLQALASTNAKNKLLLLDWGRIQFDPRLGVAYNEFPQRVEEAVREIDDPSVWVMLSHTDQAPPAIYSEQWTLFAGSLAEAFAGSADRPPANQQITLDELYSYVVARYGTWFGDTSYAAQPALLRGGEGAVTSLRAAGECVVLAVRPEPPPEEIGEDGKPVDTQASVARGRIGGALKRQLMTRVNAQASVSTARTRAGQARRLTQQGKHFAGADVKKPDADEKGDDTTEESGAGNTTAKPADSAAPDSATAEESQLVKALRAASLDPALLDETLAAGLEPLYSAWQLRDQLQDRTVSGAWSPIDFAPHSWRKLNADLLALEQQLLSGEVPASHESDLRQVRADLERLYQAMTTGANQRDSRDLVAAWQAFRSGPAFATFTPSDPLLAQAAEQLRSLHSALFDGVWFLQWLATEATTAPNVPHFVDVRNYLRAAVDLHQQFARLAGQEISELHAGELSTRHQAVIETRGTLDRLIQQDLARALPKDFEPGQRALYERHIAALLGTPLLKADQRMPLVAALLVPRGEYRDVDESWDLAQPTAITSAQEIENARRLTELQSELAAVHSASEIGPLHDPLSADQLRAISIQLRAWDVGLANESDYYARLLADPRDGTRSELPAQLTLLPPKQIPALVARVESREPLVLDEWKKIAIRIEGQGESLRQIFATVRFDPEQLAVAEVGSEGTDAGGAPRELASGERVALDARDATNHLWHLLVKARGLASANMPESSLSIQLTSSGLTDHQQAIAFALPAPSTRVRLEVRREGSATAETQLAEGSSLRPFPNRTTGFQFFLVNPSLKPRKIQVDLFAAPTPPADVKRAPGRFFQEEVLDGRLRRALLVDDQQLRSDIRAAGFLFGTATPVTLDASEPGKRIELKRVPPAAPPAAEGQPPPPAPELPALDRDISYGLIAVLTDADNPDDQWIEWLEINPLRPSRYLRASAAYEDDRIVVRLQTTSAPNDISSEKPIQVQLEAGDGIPEAAAMRELDKISSPSQEGLVWIAAPADGKRRRVRLHVDGVPRAFEFEVTCEPGGIVEDVRINKLAMEIATLSPEVRPPAGTPNPAEPPPVFPPQTASNDPNDPNVFRTCDRLLVDLKADAPETRFDLIEIGLAEDRKLAFYSDRLERTRLVGEGGALLLATTVSDLRIPLDVQGRQGPLILDSRAFDNGENPPSTAREANDSVRFILDGTRPVLDPPILGNTRVPKNVKLQVTLNADDGPHGSGISHITVGLDADNSGTLDEKDQPVVLKAASGTVALDVKELKEDRPYRLLAEATDRVGLKSLQSEREVQVVAAPVAQPQPKATKGTLEGIVSYRGEVPVSPNQVTVTLEGSNLPPQATGAGGSFRFENVPHGKYKLVAKGSFLNKRCEGELDNVEVPAKKKVTLVVDREKQP